MKFSPPRLSIMEGLQLFHRLRPGFNSRPYKLSVNSKENGPPLNTHTYNPPYAHTNNISINIQLSPHTNAQASTTCTQSLHCLLFNTKRHTHPHIHGHRITPSQTHTKAFNTHAHALKYIIPFVHARWQMFLCSLSTDTTNPAVCSLQLQDGLTALSTLSSSPCMPWRNRRKLHSWELHPITT